MHLVSTVTVALVALTAKVASRQITVVNNCAYTVWPGLFTDPSSPSKPTQATGYAPPFNHGDDRPLTFYWSLANSWQQSPHQKVSFTVPNNWKSGRIWGRTGCDFSNGAPGPNQCVTGGCNGGLKCDPKSGTVRAQDLTGAIFILRMWKTDG
uniref:Phosphate:H symporter (Phosphate:H symporter, variant) n=1 Tax=Ganoderma boninense TaxID=34458 RepID=A0A5K1K1H8_9APHY|nr:Phosphate:H symporter (Phosphate:H symporter, variant) [Ganoderma boninense]